MIKIEIPCNIALQGKNKKSSTAKVELLRINTHKYKFYKKHRREDIGFYALYKGLGSGLMGVIVFSVITGGTVVAKLLFSVINFLS